MPTRARYWIQAEENTVRCKLEPRECHIAPGERGYCGARENRGGVYYSLVYEHPCVVDVAPVETEFYHVLPGANVLTVGTAGCNLRCAFCNTAQISQRRPEETNNQDLTPDAVVRRAQEAKCPAICFTYNDPVVCIEFVIDTARAARKAGLKTLCHTAAMIHLEPLHDLAEVVDAFNVDLKSMSDQTYHALCDVPLAPVQEAIRYLAKRPGIFLEITTPLLPAATDAQQPPPDPAAFAATAAKWIVDNAGRGTPWQVGRFVPSYRMMDSEATPLRDLQTTLDVAKQQGLPYFYVRNTASDMNQSVRCGQCGFVVVDRSGDTPVISGLASDGCCMQCHTKVPGIWS